MEHLPEWLMMLRVRDILSFLAWVFLGISVLMEFVEKIPVKPLSIFVKWLGELVNKDVAMKIDELAIEVSKLAEKDKDQDKKLQKLKSNMDDRFEESEKSSSKKEKDRLRGEIISFSDTCRLGQKHSKAQFENVFRNITSYNNICKTYNFENHYIDQEIEYINEVYQDCLKNNNFL
jgi:hypothetical protein